MSGELGGASGPCKFAGEGFVLDTLARPPPPGKGGMTWCSQFSSKQGFLRRKEKLGLGLGAAAPGGRKKGPVETP